MRAVGAFSVSSEMKKGRIDYILIESLAGKRCELINPFDGEIEVAESNKKIKQVKITDRIISFAAKKGKIYLIKRRGKKPIIKQKFHSNKYGRKLPRGYTGPQYLSKDVDKKKMRTVRLGN